jgi:hypothetical protein
MGMRNDMDAAHAYAPIMLDVAYAVNGVGIAQCFSGC